MNANDSREAIGRFLFVSEPAQAVDIAFVLCSPTVSSISPAISLFHAGLAPYILISGAGRSQSGIVEWRYYMDYALKQGVPETAILIEKRATNTQENLMFGADLIHETLGWGDIKSLAICAKPFHMRRAIMTARKHLPKHVHLIAQPPNDPGDLAIDTWWQSDWGRARVLDELGKISLYALKGDIGDI